MPNIIFASIKASYFLFLMTLRDYPLTASLVSTQNGSSYFLEPISLTDNENGGIYQTRISQEISDVLSQSRLIGSPTKPCELLDPALENELAPYFCGFSSRVNRNHGKNRNSGKNKHRQINYCKYLRTS